MGLKCSWSPVKKRVVEMGNVTRLWKTMLLETKNTACLVPSTAKFIEAGSRTDVSGTGKGGMRGWRLMAVVLVGKHERL
jgi:hypothetical protein